MTVAKPELELGHLAGHLLWPFQVVDDGRVEFPLQRVTGNNVNSVGVGKSLVPWGLPQRVGFCL